MPQINNNSKSLELISNYSKTAGYEVNRQNSIAFLYTYKELKFGIKNTIPCIVTPNKKRHFRINLTMYVQDLYEENDNTLIK